MSSTKLRLFFIILVCVLFYFFAPFVSHIYNINKHYIPLEVKLSALRYIIAAKKMTGWTRAEEIEKIPPQEIENLAIQREKTIKVDLCLNAALAENITVIYPNEKSLTSGIQEAIDTASPTAVLKLSPGIYKIKTSIHLKSKIILLGNIDLTTIQWDRPTVEKYLNFDFSIPEKIDYNQLFFLPLKHSSDLFSTTTNIAIRDDKLGGWNTLRGIVHKIDDDGLWFKVKNYANWSSNTIKYELKNKSKISNHEPMILGESISEFGICDLKMETFNAANSKEKQGLPADLDFTDAAIHIVNSQKSTIKNITLNAFQSEGISIQGGQNISLLKNKISNNLSHGIHIGTNVRYTYIAENTISDNGGDGIYFCAQVKDSLVTRNAIEKNKNSGIGGLGGVEDTNNIIYKNIIKNNLLSGIFIEETGNAIVKNIIHTNGINNDTEFNIQRSNSEWGTIIFGNILRDGA